MTNTQQGWICPKCGRVYGPAKMECGPCNAKIDLMGPSALRGDYVAQSFVSDIPKRMQDAIALTPHKR